MSEVKCKTCNQTGHNRTICLEDEDKPVANDSLNANIESEDGNGFIDRRELGLMMRFMGERLTEEEIQVATNIINKKLHTIYKF